MVTADELRTILGQTDDDVLVRILALNPTPEEVAAAHSWLTNNEAPMNAGRPLGSGKISEIIDILEAADEDRPGGPPGL